jgi:hypothetical protein
MVDGKATALLREVNGGKVRRVQKGETVNGMLVEDVKADRVRLSMNGDSEEVTMRVAPGPKSTIQPVQPQAQPQPGMPGGPPVQPGNPPIAQNAPPPPVIQDVADVLAQRRRAARAAEAAAQQRDAPAAPAVAAPAAAPTAPAAPTAAPQGAKPDPGWNAVYQRYMQPRQR